MQMNEYQEQAMITAKFPPVGDVQFFYPVLGLAGETGEVAEKIKKIIRDKNSIMSPEDVIEVGKELGDVLWYLSVLAKYIGLSLEEVAQLNIDKLTSRRERNMIHGNGDNR
jgi:NTP pyrophosphatase (non-canonical NTP hydrolase)